MAVPSTTPLTTLASLKLFLQANPNLTTPYGSLSDATLNLYIAEVSALISEWCGREFASTAYVEYYSGSGTPLLVLNQRPVTLITNIWEDVDGFWGTGEDAFTDDPLEVGVNYALVPDQSDGSSRAGLVQNLRGVWRKRWTIATGLLTPQLTSGMGNYKVSYTAGFSTIPKDIEMCCNLAIALLRRMAPWGAPLASESYEERSVSFFNEMTKWGILSRVVMFLGRYRNIGF